ncbi:conserved hypothetical protein [Planktothrix agardhii]|uniref:hypothetical protein n=1 Tax=Planktothrix agardhii TaxID=1160 RepID=UPI001B979D10|nr:hypothetical protein [Planktothrix agardhii]CAD0219578.1 conserved hypothetical protein [Planktothrix agardhii]
MSNSDQSYESHILKIAINKYLDKKLTNSQKDLEKIELNKDEFVWDIVTKIHSQSGYKVSISFARDIIDQRIVNIKEQLKEAEEKARLEMIRIKAEKVEKQIKNITFLKKLPPELNFDATKSDIFIRVYKICCEYDLCDEFDELDSDEIFDQKLFIKILQTTIFPDEYYEYYINIILELEEEFNIRIGDEEAENLKTVRDIVEIIYTKIVS